MMAAVKEARRLAALRDPATLGRYCDPRNFRIRAHTRLVAGELANLGPENRRLILTTPPQIGKSTIASEYFPFWWLIKNPRHKIVIASYAASLAISKGRMVRELVRERGHLFGLSMQPGAQAAQEWELRQKGGIRSTGVGGSLTGYPANVVVLDDPHKDRAEADSRKQRDKVWDWWSSTVLSRLHPDAVICIIMTRWHDNDLVARVIESDGLVETGGRWRMVHLEAIATGKAPDPLGREPGAPLSHPAIDDLDIERLLAHWRDKRETSTGRDWGSLYQGDPKPAEGALVTRALMARQRHVNHVARPVITAVAIDPSGGGRDVAGVIGGYRDEDGRVYLIEDASDRMPSEQWARAACKVAAKIKADRFIIEKNYGGDMVVIVLRTAWAALRDEHEKLFAGSENPYAGLMPRIVTVTARKGKLIRAEPVAQQFSEDRIRWGSYLGEAEEEWCTWQPGSAESPGRLDAIVHLAHGLLTAPGSAASVAAAGVTDGQRPEGPDLPQMPGWGGTGYWDTPGSGGWPRGVPPR